MAVAFASAPGRIWTSSSTAAACRPPAPPASLCHQILAPGNWRARWLKSSTMLPAATPCRRGGWGSFGGPPSALMVSSSMGGTSAVSVEINDGSDKKFPPLPARRTVVGCGTLTLDFLAKVASYPEADAKIRTTDSLVQGGGNVGNALTAAARLGLKPRVYSKLAKDSSGIGILEELEADGVDVSHVVVADEGVSPFTYVIVDEETKTRTCIHTPGYPPLEPSDYSSSAIASLLSGADLLYLDGRIPDAALRVAEEASKQGLPIIIDAERKREGLDELLHYADYLVTSAKFPVAWTEAPTLGEALVALALKLPRLQFVIVTQGAAGCVMLERSSSEKPEMMDVNQTLQSLWREAKESPISGPTVFSSKVGVLQNSKAGTVDTEDRCVGRLLVGTADFVPSTELVDTTGAGDAFIGAVMYCLCAGLIPENMLPLGSAVAATKCRALGARTGLPLRGDARVLPYLL
ncbi:hypothetical protein MPTK1_3g14770 [Marchantia polymorpha subsp. ruderalis]|uniref:Carbohydrate kinase PfkB domain-containing protein n=2 Tax=Marchantia polymorpha TaxID=3197 RepID=A0AAF6B0W1_MARPO|nr:hypothetical protein MARPO_0004s0194 [Marchantia polymorpha]PTQ48938.1 hypothetical protein MARPO_0004s0194 [Marchantia polymorpha]BBN05644.1 hypothetical protein Mp_3g14770 [Marchantia polymorpha subsp. ruderalis]BBN05645.1 hypothetical protein Mp_3g14770 [Marchantia polymorpha subsp. ruderalis]|eukprot:PTQ48937.1 hypothetical protein MARPO_0004s0194 [Marchantia polymorpha]